MSESSGLASFLMEPKKSLIPIPLYYCIVENKSGVIQPVVLEDEEGKKRLDEGDKSVEVLNTQWKQPCWKEQNELIEKSRRLNTFNNKIEVEWNTYRDLKIKTLLVEWDLKYNGQVIPLAPENIDALPDVIVFALVDRYDRSTAMDPQEREKS